jgi:hypothetical protein
MTVPTPGGARARAGLFAANVCAALVALASCGEDDGAPPNRGASDALDAAPADAADAAAGGGDAAAAPDAPADQTPCDDGRACTVGDRWQGGECVSGANVCPCEPGFLACPAYAAGDAVNLCLGPQVCRAQVDGAPQPYLCLPDPQQHKVCDGSLDGVCVKNACAPLSGVCSLVPVELTVERCDLPAGLCRREVAPPGSPPAALTACDDGFECTLEDRCQGGVCGGADASCVCKSDSDCADDGDLCNGVPFCNKSGPVWTCALNPASKI